MLIVSAGIQDSLELEGANNNLKKEKSAFGKLSIFNWDRFAFIYSIRKDVRLHCTQLTIKFKIQVSWDMIL